MEFAPAWNSMFQKKISKIRSKKKNTQVKREENMETFCVVQKGTHCKCKHFLYKFRTEVSKLTQIRPVRNYLPKSLSKTIQKGAAGSNLEKEESRSAQYAN